MDNEIKRVGLYIRVSTEEQSRHGLSVEEQTDRLTKWAKKQGYYINGYYTDSGISARKKAEKRPALQSLLVDIKAGKINLVLFTKLDRWFRNVAEYYKVQDILDEYGAAWKATEEDYETETASGRLKVNIMLSVAQDEADRASERIKFVFDGKRERKEPLTGNCPTGYKIEGKRMIKDPETEQAVSEFFKKFLECGSVSETQEYVRREYGLLIEYQLASKMLYSPVYYGYYYEVDGMAPAYITKEQFDRIQSMRQKVVRKTKENRVYLFSGLIKCGECGYRLGGRTNRRGGAPFYNCPGHYIRRNCENKTNLSERKIEAYILGTLEEKCQKIKWELQQINASNRQTDYTSEISALKAKIRKLKDLYLNDLITIEEYKKDKNSFQTQIDYLEKNQLAKQPPKLDHIEKILQTDWRNLYANLPKTDQRDFWRVLIAEIRLYADRHIEYDVLI